MTPSCHCPHAASCPANPRRRMTLRGSREEALEYLPAFCADERLELDAGRISLVCARTRVDVHVVAEAAGEIGHDDEEKSLLLLELVFAGRSEREADAFVQRYRHRVHLATRCH